MTGKRMKIVEFSVTQQQDGSYRCKEITTPILRDKKDGTVQVITRDVRTPSLDLPHLASRVQEHLEAQGFPCECTSNIDPVQIIQTGRMVLRFREREYA